MPGTYGQSRLQQAPRRRHSMEEGRTTTHDEGDGKRIVNLGLGWMQIP